MRGGLNRRFDCALYHGDFSPDFFPSNKKKEKKKKETGKGKS